MNLEQRVSVVSEAVRQAIHAALHDGSDNDYYQGRLNQLTKLLQVELGAELLTLGKAIALLEVGKVDAAHRLLRARAKELR